MRKFAGVILVKKDGSVLAQHRDNAPGITGQLQWAVVGGSLESDDVDVEATAIRELREETGYVIKPGALHFLTQDVYMNERYGETERNIFWAEYDEDQQINCHEGQEIKFVLPEELSKLDIYTGNRHFLEMASSVMRAKNIGYA